MSRTRSPGRLGARLRARYGRGPLHLIGLIASFAVAGAAVLGWTDRPRDLVGVLVWFGAAIVGHDLVLLPLYSLTDRVTVARVHRRALSGRPPGTHRTAVGPAPYLRVPALVSGLVLAALFPTILGFGARTELAASGIREHGYLVRWLLLTGVVFAISGVAFARARALTRPPGGGNRASVSGPEPPQRPSASG